MPSGDLEPSICNVQLEPKAYQPIAWLNYYNHADLNIFKRLEDIGFKYLTTTLVQWDTYYQKVNGIKLAQPQCMSKRGSRSVTLMLTFIGKSTILMICYHQQCTRSYVENNMKNNLLLSEKHGVNPSVTKCFLCGEDVGVALFGKMKGDVEAPRSCILDYEPCSKCKDYMKQGVILISVRNNDKDYRTGGWVVVTDDYIKKAFLDPDQILKKRAAFIADSAWDLLGLPRGMIDYD